MKRAYLLPLIAALQFFYLFAAGQIQIGNQTQNRGIPISPNKDFSYSQVIYAQHEISNAVTITGLQYYFNGSSLSNSNHWSVYMGHTSKSSFSGTSDWIPLGELTEVWSGTFSSPSGSGWVTFEINDFLYNNLENLVIAVNETAPGHNASSNWFHSSFSGDWGDCRSIYYRGSNPVDPASPPTASNYQPYLANIILLYDGAYSASTTTQITSPIGQGKTNQPVIRIELEVVDANADDAATATQFTVNMNGSSVPVAENFENARIFYTGNSDIFNADNQFGETFPLPEISDFTISGTQDLVLGINFFWLTVDTKPGAATGDVVDAECISLAVDGNIALPDITAPEGNRVITPPLAGTYTIGAGSDYDSFALAAEDLNNLGISGEVIFPVNPGTYTEQLLLNQIEGATEQNTITFQSAGGNPLDVVLQFAPQSSATNYVVHFRGTDHVTLKDMTIQNTGNSGYGKVIVLSEACNVVTVSGNILNGINIDFQPTYDQIWDYAILSSLNGEEHLCNYVLIQNNEFNNGCIGINLEGFDDQHLEKENQIIGNTFEGFYSVGVHLWYQKAPFVNQNILTGNQSVIAEISGIKVMDSKNDLEISQNQVFLQSPEQNYGIEVWYCYADESNPGLIANNYVCLSESPFIEGIGIMECGSQYVYHNTIRITEVPGKVYDPKSGGTSGCQVDFWSTSASNGNIRLNNNIITNEGQIPLIGLSEITMQEGYLMSDYNCFYTEAAVFAKAGNTQVANLEAWKILTGNDANSGVADPGYVSVINPTPENQLLEGFAPVLPLVHEDLFNQPRNPEGTAPGAVEMGFSPQQQITWSPTAGNDWNNPENWDPPKVPDQNDNVYIPDKVPYPPAITGNAECNNLELNTGARLHMSNGSSLNVNGDLSGAGGIYTTPGSSANVNISGSNNSLLTGFATRKEALADSLVSFTITKPDTTTLYLESHFMAHSFSLLSGNIDLNDYSLTVSRNLNLSGGQTENGNGIFFIGPDTATFQSGGNLFREVWINKSDSSMITQMDNLAVDSLMVNSGNYRISDGLHLSIGVGISVYQDGVFQILGADDNVTVLEGNSWYFEAHDGAGISAVYSEFKNVNENGVFIMPGAVVDENGAFYHCAFSGSDSTGVLLTLDNNQDLIIEYAVFNSTTKSQLYNIRKSVDEGSITFDNESGNLAGADFEDDPYNRIYWSSGQQNQGISLQGGWSGISSNLSPDNPEVGQLMEAIKDQLIILRDDEGNFYQPAKSNTLTTWDFKKGYFIKMASPETLEITGIYPLEKEINMMAGWNLFPVLSKYNISVEDYFRSNLSKLEIVTEVAGVHIYWPEKEVLTLQELIPGKAYLAKTFEPFTLFEVPVVTTAEVTDIASTTATSGGEITDQGYSPVTARGVVWSTLETPSLSENEGYTNEGSGEGFYESYMAGLQPETTYYVCAYATNSAGTGYGEILSFNTPSCVPPTVDAGEDVNVCGSVDTFFPLPDIQHAEQIFWTTSGDGTFDDPTQAFPEYTFGEGDYNNGGVILSISVYAPLPCTGQASDDLTVEITPLPSVDAGEDITVCQEFEVVVSSTAENYSDIEWTTLNGHGTLVNANQLTMTYQVAVADIFIGFTDFVVFAQPVSPCVMAAESMVRVVHAEQPEADAGNDQLYIYGPSATLSGNDPPAGGTGEWSNIGTPGSFTDPSSPTTEFSGDVGYLYTLVWTINDQFGCEDSDTMQVSFLPQPVSGQPCPGTPTVTDINGNVYNTVQIGIQCWMQENLKVEAPGSWCYNDDPVYCEMYGRLYDWNTIMSGAAASNEVPSGVQGICPEGWHVPSHSEWDIFTAFMFENGTSPGNMAKSCRQVNSPLGGGCNTSDHPRWNADDTHFGTDDFNFSALPAGWRWYSKGTGTYEHLGYQTWWWTTNDAPSYPGRATTILMGSDKGGIYYSPGEKEIGMSLRCVRDGYSKPVVNTAQISSLAYNAAVSGGDVINNGGLFITARGVVWSQTPAPTIDNHMGKTSDGMGAGKFVSNISGLLPEETYYLRAYATNSVGTEYGQELIFTTTPEFSVPTVEYHSVVNTTASTAKSGGTVVDDGGSDVWSRGVIWSTQPSPTLNNPQGITLDGEGTGQYESLLTGLTPETTYYLRAWAENEAGVGYSDVIVFETLEPGTGEPCFGMTTLTDPRDGSIYPIVEIGGRCWMADNLAWLPEVNDYRERYGNVDKYFVQGYTGNDVEEAKATAYYQSYGVQYTWYAALGACPEGWSLPTKDEWKALADTMGGKYIHSGTQLKSCRDVYSPYGDGCQTSEHPRWESFNLPDHYYGTDDYGFSGLPGGGIDYDESSVFLTMPGRTAQWWTSTNNGDETSWIMLLSYSHGSPAFPKVSIFSGYNVRCIKSVSE